MPDTEVVEPTVELAEDFVYGDLESAATYLANRKLDYATWSTATEAQQTIALNQAAELIDNLVYVSERVLPDQTYEWPRVGYDPTPDKIVYAAYEIAFAIICGRDVEMDAATRPTTRSETMLGTHQTDIRAHSPARLHNIPSEYAWRLLCPFLRDVNSPVIERTN